MRPLPPDVFPPDLALHPRTRRPGVGGVLGRWRVSAEHQRAAARLAVLPDHLLRDMGVTRDAARSCRPWW